MKIYNKDDEHIEQLIIIKCDICNSCYELEKDEIKDTMPLEIICKCYNKIFLPSKARLLFITLYNNLSNEFSEIVEKLNPKKEKINKIIFAHKKMINIITEK